MGKKTILLADSNKKNLLLFKQHLEGLSYNIVSSFSQKETEGIIMRTKPDLAIFDLIMENDDSGFVLAYKFKKRYPDVPVIIQSSSTRLKGITFSLNSEEECRWIKADAIVEKTTSPEHLQKEIFKLLKV